MHGRLSAGLAAVRAMAANPELTRIERARLVSVTARWAYTVTLGVYAYQWRGASGVALAGVLRLLPGALVAPLAGGLATRFRLEKVQLTAGLGRASALAAAGVSLRLHGAVALVLGLVALGAG